ncbi:MAG: hypothetical protein MUF31_13745 [Akkermansiaceae bacterium]|jgi:hypothetical protein|nr:hypothetical protein [Akkermansiaceae bacterium]
MKKTMKATTLTAVLTILVTPFAFAAEDHDHDHEKHEEHGEHEEHGKKGPNGGHVVESKAGFTLEVTVDKERKARIIFLDKEMKPVALDAQTITGIAGERSAPTKLAFAKGKDADANVLIADKALPTGAHVPLILTVKTTADAKAITERFELHLH